MAFITSRTSLKLTACRCNRSGWMRTSTDSSSVVDRGVKLAYASYQQTNEVRQRLPLIIMHGLFGSKKNFESLAQVLGRTRKVVAVDCRNHGESPHVTEMTYHDMTDDIDLLMSELNMEKADFLGHSMGGKVAMTLALTKPHLVSKLIVEDVSPTVTRTAFSTSFPLYLSAMKNTHFDNNLTLAEMRRSAHGQLIEAFPEQGIRDFVVTNITKGEDGFAWKLNLDSIISNLDDLVAFPHLDSTYSGPSLFIKGSLSNHIVEKDRPEIYHFFPHAQIKQVEGAGHWVHSEKPHEVIKMVLDFLNHDS